MSIVILGVDLGKNACSVVGVDAAGAVVVRRSMRRQTLIDYVAKLPACVIAMVACCGVHHLGRLFAARGHEIRLMSPEYVRPYVKAQKNDDRDAEGIAEAASRSTMRFVELKSQDQLDVQTLHRVRSRLVAERRNLINQFRAILLERGTIFPVGRRKLELGVDALLAEEDEALSLRVRKLVGELRAEWRRELDVKIEALNGEFIKLARNDAAARRLISIPGIGVLNATALMAAVGDAGAFCQGSRSGRLAGPGSPATYHGRQATAARHLQARQHLLAHPAHPRGSSSPAFAVAERHPAGTMAEGHDRARTPSQCRGSGAGQQAGADRLGSPAQGGNLRARLSRRGITGSATCSRVHGPNIHLGRERAHETAYVDAD